MRRATGWRRWRARRGACDSLPADDSIRSPEVNHREAARSKPPSSDLTARGPDRNVTRVRPPVLIVARQSGTLLGLAQAVLKFGYQIVTAYPETGELERAERVGPALVIVRPPAEPEARRKCLDLVKKRFRDRG